MDGSSLSSATSTSHTLSVDHPQLSMSDLQASGMPNLISALSTAQYSFIQPPQGLSSSALSYSKHLLDGIAPTIADEQLRRQQEARRKRKRGRDASEASNQVLQLRKLHVDGFAIPQVWEQARRIIDALKEDAENALTEDFNEEDGYNTPKNLKESIINDGGVKLLRFDEDGFEVGSDEDMDGDEDGEDAKGESQSEQEDVQGESKDGSDNGLDDYGESSYGKLTEDDDDDDDDDEEAGVYVEDPHGLNDGFFSIDDFNKQTEFLEQQDAAGDPFKGQASDEEDIDWSADPLATGPSKLPAKRKATNYDLDEGGGEDDSEDDSEDDGEDGLTFGNMDLNALEGESDEDMDDGDGIQNGGIEDNTNEIHYKNFFAPPARKMAKGGHRQDQKSSKRYEPDDDDEEFMKRTMSAVRRDLFEDESAQEEDSNDALSDLDPADPRSRRSTHERRQAKLAAQIRKLEAANVAKREWMLTGEARAAERPLNSLLEQDLDFERTGKPVPVITAEVSESIEDLIKRRILAAEFDEVVRRRPDALTTPADIRRGALELDDTKPQQSLAELYEADHQRATNPDSYVTAADAKLKNEHKEIERLWKDVSAKLDALSSWHYRPKPPAPSINVVADVPTIAMEDAQPTTAAGVAGVQSMLAPQDIYSAGKKGEGTVEGDVVLKGGKPMAKGEMTREEKIRRRREKERLRKRNAGARAVNEKAAVGKVESKAKIRKDTIAELKRGGVKVIGKKGEVRDVEGKKIKGGVSGKQGAGMYKL